MPDRLTGKKNSAHCGLRPGPLSESRGRLERRDVLAASRSTDSLGLASPAAAVGSPAAHESLAGPTQNHERSNFRNFHVRRPASQKAMPPSTHRISRAKSKSGSGLYSVD